MRLQPNITDCHCLPDCETTTYTVSKVEEPWKIDNECSPGRPWQKLFLLRRARYYNKFMHNFNVLYFNWTGSNRHMKPKLTEK